MGGSCARVTSAEPIELIGVKRLWLGWLWDYGTTGAGECLQEHLTRVDLLMTKVTTGICSGPSSSSS